MLSTTLASPAATRRFARVLATVLEPPALVTLEGDLGTGKTTIVRGALRALGVRGPVTSPSFTLAQSYRGRGDLRLHHLDLYRLGPGLDTRLFAWDDYLEPCSVVFVEWPEAGVAELPPADVRIELIHRSLQSRDLLLHAAPALEARLAAGLREQRIEIVAGERT